MVNLIKSSNHLWLKMSARQAFYHLLYDKLLNLEVHYDFPAHTDDIETTKKTYESYLKGTHCYCIRYEDSYNMKLYNVIQFRSLNPLTLAGIDISKNRILMRGKICTQSDLYMNLHQTSISDCKFINYRTLLAELLKFNGLQFEQCTISRLENRYVVFQLLGLERISDVVDHRDKKCIAILKDYPPPRKKITTTIAIDAESRFIIQC
jgi:hypothetical protein